MPVLPASHSRYSRTSSLDIECWVLDIQLSEPTRDAWGQRVSGSVKRIRVRVAVKGAFKSAVKCRLPADGLMGTG